MRTVPWIATLVTAATLGSGARADEKPRVYVKDSTSWAVSGDSGAGGGAEPQTAEIIKTIGARCPSVVVTMKQERADYVLLLEHEGDKGVLSKDNKFAVFAKGGDALGSGSTRTLANSVKDACAVMLENWKAQSSAASPDAKPADDSRGQGEIR